MEAWIDDQYPNRNSSATSDCAALCGAACAASAMVLPSYMPAYMTVLGIVRVAHVPPRRVGTRFDLDCGLIRPRMISAL